MKQRFFQNQNFKNDDVDFFIEKGLPLPFAKILSSRGVTKHSFDTYFGFSEKSFHDPFLMQNMDKAVETLKSVFKNDGAVLIFGDYDADGLSASAVLSLFFKHNGIENDVAIPTRSDGYGMNVEKILSFFEKKQYKAIVTVDCGISNKPEIDFLKQKLGDEVEIIVTDHHELPNQLPDCICINPKLGYPFENLSGSGVAFKLVQALSGLENASKYADLATLGTIADIMPLVDENRALVALGLKNFRHHGLVSLALASKCSQSVSANDIGMKIAPKINAAGRMGDPDLALKLLLAEEKSKNIEGIVSSLININEQRRKDTEEIYQQCSKQLNLLASKHQKFIFVCGSWNVGLQGIVANRLVEQFNLPTFVATNQQDKIVGSARGVEGVDIHSLLENASPNLLTYGGHKSAGGFSLNSQNLELFKASLATSLKDIDNEIFSQKAYYDVQLDGSFSLLDLFKFNQTLEPLAPNDCLTVRIQDFVKSANTFGATSSHLNITLSNGFEIKAFNNFSHLADALKSGAEVDLLVTLNEDSYNGNICGILRDIEFKNSLQFEGIYQQNYLENVTANSAQRSFLILNDVKNILAKDSVVAVFDCYEDFQQCSQMVDFSDFFLTFFAMRCVCDKAVVISPLAQFDYSLFENVIVFCGNHSVDRKYCENAVYVQFSKNDILSNLQVDRHILTLVFKALKKKSRFESLKTVFNKYLLGKISYLQFSAALKIFSELKIVGIKNQFDIEFLHTEKTDLQLSTLFQKLNKN